MVEAVCLHHLLRRHAVIDDVEDRLEHRRDDGDPPGLPSTRRTRPSFLTKVGAIGAHRPHIKKTRRLKTSLVTRELFNFAF